MVLHSYRSYLWISSTSHWCPGHKNLLSCILITSKSIHSSTARMVINIGYHLRHRTSSAAHSNSIYLLVLTVSGFFCRLWTVFFIFLVYHWELIKDKNHPILTNQSCCSKSITTNAASLLWQNSIVLVLKFIGELIMSLLTLYILVQVRQFLSLGIQITMNGWSLMAILNGVKVGSYRPKTSNTRKLWDKFQAIRLMSLKSLQYHWIATFGDLLLTIDNLNKQLPEFNPLNSTSKDSKIYKKVRVKTYDIIIIKIENCYCNINVFHRFYLFNKSNGLQFIMLLFLRFLGW